VQLGWYTRAKLPQVANQTCYMRSHITTTCPRNQPLAIRKFHRKPGLPKFRPKHLIEPLSHASQTWPQCFAYANHQIGWVPFRRGNTACAVRIISTVARWRVACVAGKRVFSRRRVRRPRGYGANRITPRSPPSLSLGVRSSPCQHRGRSRRNPSRFRA